MLKALQEVVSKAGGNMNETSRTSVLSLLEADVDETEGMSCLNTKLRLRSNPAANRRDLNN